MSTEMFWIIAAMTAATFPSRFLPASLLKHLHIGDTLKLAMQITPFCIMVSMLTVDIASDGATAAQKLVALLPVLPVSYKTGNVGLGVLSGVCVYSAVVYFL